MRFAKVITLMLLIVMLFLISSCSSISNPKQDKYYTGTEGVQTTFIGNSPPSTVYYYSDGKPEDNEFDIEVNLHNVGASMVLGGVFVSGYDPALIQIEGVNPPMFTMKDCVFDISSIVSDLLNMHFDCGGTGVDVNQNGNWEVRLSHVGELLSKIGVNLWDTSKILSDLKIVFGSDGVSVSFNNPDVSMDYYNHGRGLIAYAAISGDLDFSYGQEYVLPADDYNYPGGGIDYKVFNAKIKDWPIGLDETQQTFLITNCYLYATYAAPTVCIDSQPYTETKKVCYPVTISWKGSQGAPVAISSIEEENTKTKAFFTINIANVGKSTGKVFAWGRLRSCNPYNTERTTDRDLDVVFVKDVRIGKDRLDCDIPDNTVRLQNGQGSIRCSYDYRYASSKNAYTTPLIVELWYGYSDTIQKNVILKRVT
jgi:hypothetical protein